MAVQDWSTSPSANVTVDGINISEGAPPGNVNNAIRAIMASVRVMYGNLPSGGDYAPKNAPIFTGQPTYQGRGAFLHHNNAANASGRIFIQAAGSPAPAMVNGDILLEY
jgi:hypothetical protein